MVRKNKYCLILCFVLSVAPACVSVSNQVRVSPIVSVDEVGHDSAMVWMLSDSGKLEVRITTKMGELKNIFQFSKKGTNSWFLDGLKSGEHYQLQWQFTAAFNESVESGVVGFYTAPQKSEPTALRFAFSGDLGGQDVCRDQELGYPIFTAMTQLDPDFFIALGDMVYADNECTNRGRYGNSQIARDSGVSRTAQEFSSHWQYQFNDKALANFRSAIPWYATWDDHEVINDFSAHRDFYPDDPEQRLLVKGKEALRAFNPISGERLYRNVRWGSHVELFIIDTRSYRDANSIPDTAEESKSLLGNEQRKWLLSAVTNSTATWKVIVTSVPLSIPTGTAEDNVRDGWASGDSDTGFERELLGVLDTFRKENVKNLVFLTADVHFATGFESHPFDDEFYFHEYVVGPLNAGVFPNRNIDSTLNPKRLFFHGPDSPDDIESFEDAMRWFNFGLIDIDQAGKLTFSLIDGLGKEVFSQELMPD